jgi:hypothetical protein
MQPQLRYQMSQVLKHSNILLWAEDASNAGGTGSSGVEGSRGPAVQLVPFQSMPQSTQEELGMELFDDPLLSIENVKKLTDYMQWSFKYIKVSLLLLFFAYIE